MKLTSFGCSFIFGSDLHDNPESTLPVDLMGKFSYSTWPALLAKKLNYDYDCHARPGSGNLQIAERVLNQCSHQDSKFFIINWTYIDRFDYTGISTANEWQPWGTVTPACQTQIAKAYYQHLHSEYKDKLSTLIYIKTVIDMLLKRNIKFLMTYMDNLMFDRTWHVTPAVNDLQEYIKPYMTTFDGHTFLEWSRMHGYPESSTYHPLEDAHQAAANHMIKMGYFS